MSLNDHIILKRKAREIVTAGVHQVLGDNYGIKNFFLPIFLTLINNDTFHTAGYGPLTTLLNFVAISGYSTLFQLPSKIGDCYSVITSETAPDSEKEKAAEEVRTLLRAAFIYSVTIAIPLSPPLIFCKRLLITPVIGYSNEIASISDTFLPLYALSIAPNALIISFGALMMGTGNTKIFLVGSAILAACLTFTAIFALDKNKSFEENVQTLLGFYLAEVFVSAALYSMYAFLSQRFKFLQLKEKFFQEFHMDWETYKTFLKDGFASTVRIASDFLFPFLINSACTKLPKNAIEAQAAFVLASQPLWLNNLVNVFFGLADGQSLGDAKNDPTISPSLFKKIAYLGVGVSTVASFFIPAVCIVFPKLPAMIFNNKNEAVLNTLDEIAIPVALSSWLGSLYFSLMFDGQRGWNDFWIGAIASITGLIVGLAASVFFGLIMGMGAAGLASGFPIGMVPTILILARDHYHGVNKIAEEKAIKRHGWDFYQPQEEDGRHLSVDETLEPNSTTAIELSPRNEG